VVSRIGLLPQIGRAGFHPKTQKGTSHVFLTEREIFPKIKKTTSCTEPYKARKSADWRRDHGKQPFPDEFRLMTQKLAFPLD